MSKSIANQYKDVLKGRLSENQFLRNVKLTLPKYVSNLTTFKDAVRILKNKSLISESMGEKLSDETYDVLEDLFKSGEITRPQYQKVDDYLNDNNYEIFNGGDFYDAYAVIEYVLNKLDLPNPLNEGKEEVIYNPLEYNLGMRYELEENKEDKDKAEKTVEKNLKSNPVYYSELHLAGYDKDKIKKDKKKRTDLPIEVKKDNFTDKDNGFKKAPTDKLTENEVNFLIGKILNEDTFKKKLNLTEGIEDQIQQKAQKRIDWRQEHYGEVSDVEKKLYRILSIKDLLKNPNLSDDDKSYLETEFSKLTDKPSTPIEPTVSQYNDLGKYKGD